MSSLATATSPMYPSRESSPGTRERFWAPVRAKNSGLRVRAECACLSKSGS